MDSETPVTYAVQIISVRDETAKNEIASALTRVAKNIPEHRIRTRLDRLPWTVARTGVKANAERLVKMCNQCGAEVEVTPPLLQATAFVTTQPVEQALPAEGPVPEAPSLATSRPETEPRSDEYLPKPARPARQTPEPQPLPAGGSSNERTETGDGWFSEPLSVTGILNRSFELCKTHFWNLAATSGVFWLVFGAVKIWSRKLPDESSIYQSMIAGPGFAVLTVLLLVMLVQHGALVYAVSSIYMGREASIRESYKAAWRKARHLILTGALFLLIVFGLCCAFFVVVVITSGISMLMVSAKNADLIFYPCALAFFLLLFCLMVKFGLTGEVIMLEGKAYSTCLRRSWNLLSGNATNEWPKGYYTRFAIIYAIVLLVHSGIEILFAGPGVALSAAGLKTSGFVVNQFLQIIGDILGGTFGAVSGVVFYYDIRSRKEGFDLHQLASQVSL